MRTTQWFRREGNMAEKQSDKTYQQKRKRMITITAVVVLVIFIGYTILGSLLSAVYAKDSTPEGDGEMRGVWVSTVYSLDYPEAVTADEEALRQQADEILDDSKAMGMNAVFLQVRPSADALYESEYYPWSRYLTGTQGKAPENGFDPLEYWVEAAHERGMEFHAWINPYRVTRSGEGEYQAMSSETPAKQHPEWLVQYGGNYYFDPALPQVRRLVTDGALEIVKNYDVDGIHLDDYFYPGQDFNDQASYEKYGGGFDDIGDFRRDNVNQLIRTLDEELHEADSEISFGVSPFGIWANKSTLPEGSDTKGTESYSDYYADTVFWAREGIVDYLAPQIYWNIGYSIADYQVLAQWWSDILSDTDTELYIGLADYKSAEASGDPSSVWNGTAELKRQMDMNRKIGGIGGEIHFRYRMMKDDVQIPSFLADYYGADASEDDGRPGTDPEDGKEEPDDGTQTEGMFSDVAADSWYYDAVSYVVSEGLMNGISDNLFSPAQKLNRGMTVTILHRLAGTPSAETPNRFSDVEDGSWYEDAVSWASSREIVTGYDEESFGPSDDITREQMAVIFYRYAKDAGMDVTSAGQGVDLISESSGYSDGHEVSSYAADAVKWAVGSGLISGRDDGTLDPKGTASRAEAAQILKNFCEKIAG